MVFSKYLFCVEKILSREVVSRHVGSLFFYFPLGFADEPSFTSTNFALPMPNRALSVRAQAPFARDRYHSDENPGEASLVGFDPYRFGVHEFADARQ